MAKASTLYLCTKRQMHFTLYKATKWLCGMNGPPTTLYAPPLEWVIVLAWTTYDEKKERRKKQQMMRSKTRRWMWQWARLWRTPLPMLPTLYVYLLLPPLPPPATCPLPPPYPGPPSFRCHQVRTKDALWRVWGSTRKETCHRHGPKSGGIQMSLIRTRCRREYF